MRTSETIYSKKPNTAKPMNKTTQTKTSNREMKNRSTNNPSKPKIFYLVDFASRLQPGFRNNLVSIHLVPSLIIRYRHFECYTTYFLFPREILEHLRNNYNPYTKRYSISGYDGEVHANYLPIDIDSKDLSQAQNTTKTLLSFLLNDLKIQRKAVLIYFSGSSGFHLMIDTRAFGEIKPSKNLHLIFSNLRSSLAIHSKLNKQTIDLTIKDKLRLWRLPNTINQKSNLYKIQLSLNDLFKLTPDEIKKKAQKPQSLFYTDRTGLIPTVEHIIPNEKTLTLFKEALKRSKPSIKPFRSQPPKDFDLKKIFCKAELHLATHHIPEGYRNNSAIRLLSKIRLKGFDRETAENFVKDWNLTNEIFLPESELHSIVRSVYSRNYCYDYGCNDEILKKFCPYKDRNECKHYRIHKIMTINK
jgi:hypothetical protein